MAVAGLVIGLTLLGVCLKLWQKMKQDRLWRETFDRMRAWTREAYLQDEKAGFAPGPPLEEQMAKLSQWEVTVFRHRR